MHGNYPIICQASLTIALSTTEQNPSDDRHSHWVAGQHNGAVVGRLQP
ncbi:MAG: hypothetical protein NW214_00670 [Pseudanabaenaceae cyanobacterium bins.39]|nr:hypothetical protein [Pseudanabaenaceae cyanobacterium bins.39]